MKKVIFFIPAFTAALFLFGPAGTLGAQANVSIDVAIRSVSQNIEGKLSNKAKVVVFGFNSTSQRLSDYIADELTEQLVNGGKLVVVDRKNLALIEQEMNFQTSGEVSDDSMQAIGAKLGAEYIISGNGEDVGPYYRIRIRTLEVRTAIITSQISVAIAKDAEFARLTDTSVPRGRTIGGKVATGFMNLLFGLGSYTSGDTAGGLTVSGAYLAGAGLIVWELVGLKYEDDLAGIPGTVGLGVIGLGAVYGFVRPFLVKSEPGIAYIADGVNLALVPGKQGIKTISLSYKFSY
jgi:TolB-like protein